MIRINLSHHNIVIKSVNYLQNCTKIQNEKNEKPESQND